MIKLQTGSTIEAEEAWQNGEGIWYRKGGVVSLLDPKDVKAIEKPPAPSPQPSPDLEGRALRGRPERDGLLVYINADSPVDPLHSDPRFPKLVQRIVLPGS
jgi:hypothetical protein